MKTGLVFALSFLFSTLALASHPHDRVCVGQLTVPGQGYLAFVLQWEVERTYENGDPNQDPHLVSVEARVCDGDSQAARCGTFAAAPRRVQPGPLQPMTLRMDGTNGQMFFAGSFDPARESLTGLFSMSPLDNNAPTTKTTLTLSCVSQPVLNLEEQP